MPSSACDNNTNGTPGISATMDASGTTGLPGMAITFFFNDTATTEIYTLSLHDALPIFNNVGLLEANGGDLDLSNDTLANTGTLKATSSSTLELINTEIGKTHV